MNSTGKDAEIKEEESLSSTGRLRAFTWCSEGNMNLYVHNKAPYIKDGEELFRSMHNAVSRQNGCKTAISKVKLEVKRSELSE